MKQASTPPNIQSPPDSSAGVSWKSLRPEDFTSDGAAVVEWNTFLESRVGRLIVAVIQGAHPLRALATAEASSPAMIRGVAKMESESAETLLGKVTGYETLSALLLHRLTRQTVRQAPQSRKAGREITPAAAVLPNS